MNVFSRVTAVLGELPAIGKSRVNQQQGFRFRGIDDILVQLNPLLAKHGVLIVPDVIERVAEQRLTNNNKPLHVVHLHVSFTFFGLEGDAFTATGWGEGSDSGDKATNKAMTAAYKYVLTQVFAIAEADTADGDATAPEDDKPAQQRPRRPDPTPKKAPAAAPPAKPERIAQLRAAASLHEVDEMTIAAAYKVGSIDDLGERQVADALERLEKRQQKPTKGWAS